jgi:hypothetical protein
MFILRLAQPLQGFYDSDRYVTQSTDSITFTFSIDLVDMIQWHSDWLTKEEANLNGLHTDVTLISYQVVK